MLHGDVFPAAGWIDTLIDEAERLGADMVSAVAPLKNDSGYTSTALATSPVPELNRECLRLTQSQVLHKKFPESFDVNMAADALEGLPEPCRPQCDPPRIALLCNTGCFVVRLDRDWDWTKTCFSMVDGLEVVNGQYQTKLFSEDWMLSLKVAQAGGRVFATRKVQLVHRGDKEYHSNEIWGKPCDTGYGIHKANNNLA